ncbi:MAG TPA: hypothetical protein VM243_15675 [Phycisphaerae bacterium]|nr:hypothetical protein [Phycisphaerae bacterium]
MTADPLNHDRHEPHQHDHTGAHAPHSPLGRISLELVAHAPFSVSSVAIGLVFAGLICVLAPQPAEPAAMATAEAAHRHEPLTAGHDSSQPDQAAEHDHGDDGHDEHEHDAFATPLFHLFHPVHMFFSAAATTAMFWRYDRRLIKAILIGIIGAIGVCGVSDILMPYVSQFILITVGGLEASRPLHLHICVINHPELVLPFAFIGVVVGLGAAMAIERSTLFSHSLHVFSSTMASIFYLIGPFGRTSWIDLLGLVFLLVVLAVMIPCCVSDIVFPLALTRPARRQHAQTPHHCH